VASVTVQVDPNLICVDSCGAFSVGVTTPLIAVARSDNGSVVRGLDVHWTISDGTLAAIDQQGRVTGLAAGRISVTATVEGTSGSIDLTILPARVATIEILPKSVTSNMSTETTYTAVAHDATGRVLSDVHIDWSSSNPLVATIESGVARPSGGGQTILTATTSRGGFGWASLTVAIDVEPHGFSVMAISSGAYHTCAISTGGPTYCWGWDFFGQLGRGTRGSEATASPRPEKVLGEHSFRTLATGLYHSCAIDFDGKTWCWGLNDVGQLGWAPTPQGNGSTLPTLATGGTVFDSITAGNGHTCALDRQGRAWCWGANHAGQLGTGDRLMPHPQPALIATNRQFSQIVAAGDISCAIAQEDGTPYCWGQDEFGQLGDGHAGPGRFADVPTRVVGTPSLSRLAISDRHACGVSRSGTIWCWGDNSVGQLGITPGPPRPFPEQLISKAAFTEVAASAWSNCAIGEGVVWCWGHNGSGQLGNGTLDSSATPVAIFGHRTFERVVGGGVICGVTVESEAFCWGTSWTGQLGAGFYGATFSAVPIAVFPPY
jgi:alpha-tubulin suppressor-like RCC1 family protein